MTADELAELRVKAEGATQIRWRNGADPSHFGSPEVTDDKTFSYYVPDNANAAFIAAASPSVVLALLDEIERLQEVERERSLIVRALAAVNGECERTRTALTKISAIRDSIVGMQGFNFSEHAYPLVAALNEVGFEGVGHEIAAKNLGTLIDQTNRMRPVYEAAKAWAGTECCAGNDARGRVDSCRLHHSSCPSFATASAIADAVDAALAAESLAADSHSQGTEQWNGVDE